jgi:hypothetical protein
MTRAEAREAWAEQKKIRDRALDPRVETKTSPLGDYDERKEHGNTYVIFRH